MAYKELMNWVPSQKRWNRMLEGKRLWVSPRQLGCPPSREESREAANAYWQGVEAEYYAARKSPDHWARIALEGAMKLIPPEHVPIDSLAWLNHIPTMPDETKRLVAMSLIGRERYESLHGKPDNYLPDTPPVDAELSCKMWVDRFLADKLLAYKKGKLAAGTYDNYKRSLMSFRDWFGADVSIKDICPKTVSEYHNQVAGLDGGKPKKQLLWVVFSMFLHYLDNQEMITPPRNLRNPDYRFQADPGTPDRWLPEEYRAEYDKATDFGKLILLLAANCGMYGCDMGSIKYKGGCWLRRGRVKTGRKSPTVDYFLWLETQEALAKHGHLLEGCYIKELVNGKLKKNDKVLQYARKFPKNIRFLRHTSNQALEDSGKHRAYKNCFLCNKSKDISDVVYSQPKLPEEVSMFLHDWYFGK